MAAAFFTLTGNLLAERTLVFDRWTAGRTQRARASTFQVGGKGINVAKMLHRLQVSVEALCFTGGATGAECERWLAEQPFRARCFHTPVATRTGLVVRSPDQPETTFLGPDAPTEADALAACAAYLQSQPDGSVLALCGSFPGWGDEAARPLRDALAAWARRGILYVDTYGPPLAWAVTQPVRMIKINRDEFALLSGGEHGAPVRERLTARASAASVDAWVVTDGAGPVHFAARGEAPGQIQPPVVEEVSATGSGDVFLAALVHAREIQGCGLGEAVQFALPYGAANATHPGIAEFSLNQVPSPRSQHA